MLKWITSVAGEAISSAIFFQNDIWHLGMWTNLGMAINHYWLKALDTTNFLKIMNKFDTQWWTAFFYKMVPESKKCKKADPAWNLILAGVDYLSLFAQIYCLGINQKTLSTFNIHVRKNFTKKFKMFALGPESSSYSNREIANPTLCVDTILKKSNLNNIFASLGYMYIELKNVVKLFSLV